MVAIRFVLASRWAGDTTLARRNADAKPMNAKAAPDPGAAFFLPDAAASHPWPSAQRKSGIGPTSLSINLRAASTSSCVTSAPPNVSADA